jgi:hypothetical protein
VKKRRNRKALPGISAEQARQALHVLIAEGRIAGREVVKALARREKLVRDLRQRLSSLGEDVAGAVSRAAKEVSLALPTAGQRKAFRKRAGKAITAAQRKARQAQGRYLGAIRQLSKASRAKVKAIRKTSGVQASIAAAKKMAAKA